MEQRPKCPARKADSSQPEEMVCMSFNCVRSAEKALKWGGGTDNGHAWDGYDRCVTPKPWRTFLLRVHFLPSLHN